MIDEPKFKCTFLIPLIISIVLCWYNISKGKIEFDSNFVKICGLITGVWLFVEFFAYVVHIKKHAEEANGYLRSRVKKLEDEVFKNKK